MGIEITGTVRAIFETAQISEKFTKREFVVEIADNPKYPQPVLFQLTGERVHQLDEVGVGDTVRVDFSLRGRAWTKGGETKYFNSLDVWKLDVKERAAPAGNVGGGPDDDIPFASCDMAAEPSPVAKVLR